MQEVGIGLPDGKVTKITTRGGIVSIVRSLTLLRVRTFLTLAVVLSGCRRRLLRWRLDR